MTAPIAINDELRQRLTTESEEARDFCASLLQSLDKGDHARLVSGLVSLGVFAVSMSQELKGYIEKETENAE